MAISVSTTNGNTTLTIRYTKPNAMMTTLMDAVAEALFDRGLGDHGQEGSMTIFSDLTNAEKMVIVDTYIKNMLLNIAKGHIEERAAQDARDSAKSTTEAMDL